MRKNAVPSLFGLVLASLALALCGAGCLSESTDDPRRGGLFSYDEAAYQRRLAQRESALGQTREKTAGEQAKTGTLQDDLAQARAQSQMMREELAALETRMDDLHRQIEGTKSKNAVQENERRRLLLKLNALRKKMPQVDQKAQAQKEEASKKEIEELKRQIDRLLQESEALSRM